MAAVRIDNQFSDLQQWYCSLHILKNYLVHIQYVLLYHVRTVHVHVCDYSGFREVSYHHQ